jgi:hypothetical protein
MGKYERLKEVHAELKTIFLLFHSLMIGKMGNVRELFRAKDETKSNLSQHIFQDYLPETIKL